MKLCERKGVMCECLTDHSVCNTANCHRKLPDIEFTSEEVKHSLEEVGIELVDGKLNMEKPKFFSDICMRTNWADHVVITVGGTTLENIYQEWIAYKRENVKLLNDKERMGNQLKEQGELIYRLKQEVEDKETEIQKLLSMIDTLRDDLYEHTHKDQPQYYYGG